MIAWVFGGQGCEEPGMGGFLDLSAVSEVLGKDAQDIVTRGGPAWRRTEVVQPLLVGVQLATAALLPACVRRLGHSLGSFTAWAIDRPDALELAQTRGRVMNGVPGGMVISDSPPPGMYEAVRNPGQTVWAGAPDAVRAALGTGATALPTLGPWHSPLMNHAAERFAQALPADAHFLADELCTTFDWTTRTQIEAEHIVFIGPARPLYRHFPAATIWRTDTLDALDQTRRFLEAHRAP